MPHGPREFTTAEFLRTLVPPDAVIHHDKRENRFKVTYERDISKLKPRPPPIYAQKTFGRSYSKKVQQQPDVEVEATAATTAAATVASAAATAAATAAAQAAATNCLIS